ncbi:alpha/beta hydrolase [Sphingorhabdus soli]|uniref:Alpha/beta hydrolase n=1 Tax=Flavisphingopyxis soli TaxID=2601267 RepID=A0A5C6UA33_9SPHN|nr:alpha/beta fold hydrolase [Sphingorhabdus soli]TXC69041.1 alpha/beta hydrolase [Sphingorhabdus soli]
MTVSQHIFTASDGARLAWSEMGEGHPLILLHGLFSNAEINWIKFGHATTIAAAGYRVIMPDLRAHGGSAAPHDAASYPHDVLARDAEELIAHLGLDDYDFGGFSLGARTTARLVVRGARPGKAILAGMGLEGLAGWTRRKDFFLDAIANFDDAKRDSPWFMAISFMKTMKVDRTAAKLLLQSFADTDAEELAAFTMPTAVVCGTEDRDNGAPDALVAALPDATLYPVPGTHMSSVAKPELGAAIAAFLSA